MKNQQLLLLHLDDEIHWTALLKASIPDIRFLNDNVWTRAPDERNGIEDCPSGRVYLLDRDPASLPTIRRETGELEGPIAGCVVQVLRPRVLDDLVLSGRVAAGYHDGDESMKALVAKIWPTLTKLGTIGVLRPNGEIDKQYLVGTQLAIKVRAGEAKMADRATKMSYELPR